MEEFLNRQCKYQAHSCQGSDVTFEKWKQDWVWAMRDYVTSLPSREKSMVLKLMMSQGHFHVGL